MAFAQDVANRRRRLTWSFQCWDRRSSCGQNHSPPNLWNTEIRSVQHLRVYVVSSALQCAARSLPDRGVAAHGGPGHVLNHDERCAKPDAYVNGHEDQGVSRIVRLKIADRREALAWRTCQ